MDVVVIDEDANNPFEMALIKNQEPVEAFRTDGPHESLRWTSNSAAVGPPFRHKASVPTQQGVRRDDDGRQLPRGRTRLQIFRDDGGLLRNRQSLPDTPGRTPVRHRRGNLAPLGMPDEVPPIPISCTETAAISSSIGDT